MRKDAFLTFSAHLCQRCCHLSYYILCSYVQYNVKQLPLSHSCFVFLILFCFVSVLCLSWLGSFPPQVSPKKECFGTVYGWPFKFLLWFWGTSLKYGISISFVLCLCKQKHFDCFWHLQHSCQLTCCWHFLFLVSPPFYTFPSECWGAAKCISSYCSSTSSSFEQYIFGNSGLHFVLPDFCLDNCLSKFCVYVIVVLGSY